MSMVAKPKILALTTPERAGKSFCALNLAVALAQRGHRTLLVDLDPMGRLTCHLVPARQSADAATDLTLDRLNRLSCATVAGSLARVLLGGPARPVLVGSESWECGLDIPLRLWPWTVDSLLLERILCAEGERGRFQVLREVLLRCGSSFEYVVLDCPGVGRATVDEAVLSADLCITPFIPGLEAADRFDDFLGTLMDFIPIVRDVHPWCLLPNRVDLGAVETMKSLSRVEREFPGFLLSPVVPDGSASRLNYPGSTGDMDLRGVFSRVAAEVIARVEGQDP